MNYSRLFNWVGHKLSINKRLKEVAILYILFLIVSFRKHSLQEAARFSNSSKSRFSKLLKNHPDLAIVKLEELSKKQAKQFGSNIRFLQAGKLPWKIAIIIDATLQQRSSLHVQNAKRFNHGQGFVIGHQWTNIVLSFNGVLIPMLPIGFYTKTYCRKNGLKYKTEHEHVIEYIENLNLEDYVGSHYSHEVVVLADSGYDDKNIEKSIERKGWKFIIALKKKEVSKQKKNMPILPNQKTGTK